MNKEHFTALLDMGYSPIEAIDMLRETQLSTPEPAPEPEETPAPEPAPAPEPETETEPGASSPDPMNELRDEMKAFQEVVNKSLADITKMIQRNNIRTIGTEDDPAANRAEEFLAELIKGGNK